MRELNTDDLMYFSEFGNITKVTPNDYIITSNIILFLVDAASLGKAIGRNWSNIEKLKNVFRRRVVIIADSNDPETLIRNMFYNVNVISFELREAMNEKRIFLTVDEKDRGIAIGKNGERIKAIKELLKKKFNAGLNLKTKRII